MPELTPTGAVDVVERQVRRVRRRKNSYELQRALYAAIAAAGVAAILLLPIALFAGVETFAGAAWSMLAVLGVLGVRLVGTTVRGWLSRADAIRWVEREGALGGRVRTLLELGPEPVLATGFFHPLLVAEVGATLPAWTPRRLVPRRVPRGVLGTALVVLLVLAATLHGASLVSPSAPTDGLGAGRGAGAARAPRGSAATVGDRVVVAPRDAGAPPRDAERPHDRGTGGADSRLTQLSSALQENVRKQVWGEAWERVREALARTATDVPAALADDAEAGDPRTDAEGAEDARLARHDRRERTDRGTRGAAGQADDTERNGGEHAPTGRPDPADDARNGRDGTSGAGNATSPDDLFTGAGVDTSDTAASFELPLAARMRTDPAGRRQAGGASPDADPDARPALAADPRRETAAHRMPVPAAYEQVVREVYARREEP